MRSWPAQNARPAPVSTTARTSRSRSTAPERPQQVGLERDRQRVERVGAVERDRRDAVGDLVAKRSRTRAPVDRRASGCGDGTVEARRGVRPRARTRGDRSARRRHRTARRRSSAKSAAKSSSSGRSDPGDQQVAFGDPDEDPPERPELADEVRDHVGQQDPDRIEPLAGLRADQAAARPSPRSIHGAVADQAARLRIAASWISRRFDAPRQEVVAVDDDVEAAGVDGVDDAAGRPDPRRAAAGRGSAWRARRATPDRSISSSRPSVPTGRNAG